MCFEKILMVTKMNLSDMKRKTQKLLNHKTFSPRNVRVDVATDKMLPSHVNNQWCDSTAVMAMRGILINTLNRRAREGKCVECEKIVLYVPCRLSSGELARHRLPDVKRSPGHSAPTDVYGSDLGFNPNNQKRINDVKITRGKMLGRVPSARLPQAPRDSKYQRKYAADEVAILLFYPAIIPT